MNNQKIKIIVLYISIILSIHISVFLFNNSTVMAVSNSIIDGRLDLQKTSLQEGGPVQLQGQWEFYWEEFIDPNEKVAVSPMIVDVPNQWSRYKHSDGTSLSKSGFATYRMTILLHQEDIGRNISFYLPSIASAYKFWVGDQLLTSVGKLGNSRETTVPGNKPQVVSFKADQQILELTLQVSNYNQRKGGQWDNITFGTAEQITELREKSILLQVFVIGCIFIIGFYHLVLFLRRPKIKSPFYLAVACFSVALRTLLLKDTLILYMLPQINWNVAVKLEYISALIALICFLLYVRREFSFYKAGKMFTLIIGLISIYILFIAVTQPYIFTNTFILYQALSFFTMSFILIISFIGILRHYEGAYLSFIAMLILFVAVLNDIFYYSNWISTNEFVSVGLLFYLFTQSVHLARKFSRSFDNVERLTDELKGLNISLEKKVEKRTGELRKANKDLQKMEQSRRRLLASVSHELNTPLTFIHGYIKAMLDGVVPKDDSTYLRTVYGDTQMMAHLINDLQELSNLESGQVTFQFENIDIVRFISQIYVEEKPKFEKKVHRLLYEQKTSSNFSKTKLISSIDPIRIKQALLNLMINAQKFTPEGGTIKVQVEILSEDSAKQIKVSVIDTGEGISEKNLPYIFDRFYKEKSEENVSWQGIGLGLAIVKEIIDHHQGSVGVTSELGQGSTFFFTLPVQKNK